MNNLEESQTPINPLLSRVQLPGEVHRLPSRGLFYKNGELSEDVKDGELTIYSMTTVDDVTIRSPDLLLNGQAAIQVIQRCCPQVLKPNQLLAKDVDFIMVALRKVSYGRYYDMTHTHDCDGAKEHSYQIDMDQFLRDVKTIDPTSISKKFAVKLSNGQTASFHPLTYDLLTNMMQSVDESNKSPEERNQIYLSTLTNMISSVDEVTEKQHIFDWLNVLPVGIQREINEAVDRTTEWGADLTVTVKCRDCGEEIILGAPINPITFFI